MSDQKQTKSTAPRIGPGRGPQQIPGEKARNFKETMKQLASYLGRYRWTIVLVWLFAIISTVFTIVAPKILGQATDVLFSGVMEKISGVGSINFARIGEILIWLAGLYVISTLFAYAQGFIMSGVSMKVTRQLRSDINDKIHRLPFRYFDETNHGEVLSRITNDVDTINQTLNQSMTQMITAITTLIGITVMMLSISWQMTLAALCILPLTLVSVLGIIKKSQTHFRNQQRFLGHVNGHVEEMFSSHKVVKAFNGEEDAIQIFEEYNETLYETAWKANFLSGLMMPITNFIGNLTYVAICILGGYLTVTGRLTVGGIQAFIQYVRTFTQPVAQIANISNVLQRTAAAAERVFEFLAEEEEQAERPEALTVQGQQPPIEGRVDFDHVSFGYNPEHIIIRDFNATVKPGQKIAIVGPTGAGKSTMIKLLMRFYDVNSGAILVDGHDIRDFKRNELRSLFGMVLQDTWLFNDTIADNIRYAKPDATDEEVKQAAEAAQVDHFIRVLPDGYETIINEEADNISQGQKQLLTLARAILADPKILILDEATSQVDTRTEVLIQKAMDHVMEGRTSFVIAHRLSTIRNADLILVMRDGNIVEQGTHDELLAVDGLYANLYQSQFNQVS